jgi:hypothetical protein
MIKSLRVGLALLAFGLVSTPACVSADEGRSLEDVVKLFAAAIKKNDVKAATSHLTRDSQSVLAGAAWFAIVLSKPSRFEMPGWKNNIPLTEKEKAQIAAIDGFLKRHGLSEAAWKKALDEDKKKPKTDDGSRMFLVLGEVVKDKAAFLAECLKDDSLAKVFGWNCYTLQAAPELSDRWEANITGLVIESREARGRVTVREADNKETTGTIYFKMEGGVWKIDLIQTDRNWPPPRPTQPPQVQPTGPETQPPTICSDLPPIVFRCLCPGFRKR